MWLFAAVTCGCLDWSTTETVACYLRSVCYRFSKKGNVIYFYIFKSLHGNSLLCFMDPICQFHHECNFKLEIRSLVPDHLPNPQAVSALSCVVSSVFLNDVLLTSSSPFLSTVRTRRGPLRLRRQSLQVLWSYWANSTTPTTQVRWLSCLADQVLWHRSNSVNGNIKHPQVEFGIKLHYCFWFHLNCGVIDCLFLTRLFLNDSRSCQV